jgi:hypothetical protein
MLGVSQADLDMASFDVDYTGAIGSEAVGDDFDIDLTYEEHGEPLDAVMVDDELHVVSHESEMLDGDHTADDEHMNEHADELVDLDYIDEEAVVTTPKLVTDSISMNEGQILGEEKEPIDHDVEEGTSFGNGDFGNDTVAFEDPYQQTKQGIDFGDEEDTVHVFDDQYGDGGAGVTAYQEDEEEVTGHFEEPHAEDDEDPFASAADADFFESAEHTEATAHDEHAEAETNEQAFPETFKYQCTVQWQESTWALFQNSSAESQFFSDDIAVAAKDFTTFFKSTREILKSQVGDEEILEIQVPQLNLKIDEVG